MAAFMRIIIDGDGCPVRKIVIAVGKEKNIEVIIVQSIEHNIKDEATDIVRFITVDNSYQSADMKIANIILAGDILITGDYGLAALALGKRSLVISPSGKIFNNGNMDQMLFERHISASARRMGKRTKGPAPRTKKDDEKFTTGLRFLIEGRKEDGFKI